MSWNMEECAKTYADMPPAKQAQLNIKEEKEERKHAKQE